MNIEQTLTNPYEQAVFEVEGVINQASSQRYFSIPGSTYPCPSGDGRITPVDLILLMDMSGSMADEADPLSRKLEAILSTVTADKCRSDVRVSWLGIEGTKPRTQFTQTCRKYLLQELNIPRKQIESAAKDAEDGARSLIDLARHFDWRPGAKRLILFLGDEGLFQGNPQTREDREQADRALVVAMEHQVTIFTYLGTPLGNKINARTRADYERVAITTGGQAYVQPQENLDNFQIALTEISCFPPPACTAAAVPEIRPCFELRHGAQPNDPLTTNEVEVLYLVAGNPYANITFKDLRVTVCLKLPVENASSQSDALSLFPTETICFGDLLPCDAQNPAQLAAKARELVLISRQASSGDYTIALDYTCWAEMAQTGQDTFKVQLVMGS
jgi:hypothetical protein